MESLDKQNLKVAQLEKIEESQRNSFKVGTYSDYTFTRPWHFHPEYELLLVTNGVGTRMVGDHFERFEKGDLVLLGSNLPHAWISESSYLKANEKMKSESVYVQFRKKVFGKYFIDIPELAHVRTILSKAKCGLKIRGERSDEVRQALKEMPNQNAIEQLLTLIKLLHTIQLCEYEPLASESFLKNQVNYKSDKMNKIHQFIMQNFKNELDIEICADFIEMTDTSFCRFFKKHTNVTFSVYLNYIRIDFAQKLLKNTDLPIKEIGYESGFSSIVYFNQKFKDLTGMSPKAFRTK